MQFQPSASGLLPPSWQVQTQTVISALAAAVLMRTAVRRRARRSQ